MKTRRILITGPVEALEDYADAAFRAGWEGLEFPLIAVVPRIAEHDEWVHAAFDWMCVTSSAALAALEAASERAPALREVPLAVVGERSAERARELGFRIELEPAASSVELAALLLARARAGERVLWPRGDRSDELARLLREGGLSVTDPVAYTNVARAAEDPPPATDAVFFASPSAVRAWHERDARMTRGEPCVAVAIGPTTFDALLAETCAEFFDIISLPEPSPAALALILAHLDPGSAP